MRSNTVWKGTILKWITFVGRAIKFLDETKSQIDSLPEEQLREVAHHAVELAQSVITQADQQRQHKIVDTNIVISRKPPVRE